MDKMSQIHKSDGQDTSMLMQKAKAVLEGKKYGTNEIASADETRQEKSRVIDFDDPKAITEHTRSQIKNVATADLKKASISESIGQMESKIERTQDFLKLLKKLHSSEEKNAPSPQVVDAFVDKLQKFQEIAKEVKQIKNDRHTAVIIESTGNQKENKDKEIKPFKTDYASPYNTDYLKFANVLNNLSPDQAKKASKSVLDILQPKESSAELKVTEITNAEGESTHIKSSDFLRNFYNNRMLDQTPESKKEEIRLREEISNKQLEHNIKNKKDIETAKKRESLVVDVALTQNEEIQSRLVEVNTLKSKKEKLLQIVPLMDEKKAFFEIAFGDRAKQMRDKYETDLKEALSIQEVPKSKSHFIEESIQSAQHHEEIQAASNQELHSVETTINTQLFSGIGREQSNFNTIVSLFQNSILDIASELETTSVAGNTGSKTEKIVDNFLARMDNLKGKIQEAKIKLTQNDELKEQVISRSDFHSIANVEQATQIADNLVSPTSVTKINDIQKKMTPWVVSQLLY